MKTRRVERVFGSERMGERRAQAWGFVSRIMVNSEGVSSAYQVSWALGEVGEKVESLPSMMTLSTAPWLESSILSIVGL